MNDNQIKAITGTINKSQMLSVLKNLKDSGFISYCTADYRIGYPDFAPTQFYSPFYIEFENNSSWLIYTTNSIRTDRANIQQWNSFNIKEINDNVEKSLIVVPNSIKDSAKEFGIFKKYQESIHNKSIFSAIDYVVTLDELVVMIESNR